MFSGRWWKLKGKEMETDIAKEANKQIKLEVSLKLLRGISMELRKEIFLDLCFAGCGSISSLIL